MKRFKYLNTYLRFLKNKEINILGRFAPTYCYNMPDTVTIEVLTSCNLRCVWCKFIKSFNEPKEIDFEHLKKIIPTLKGIRSVVINPAGEPLLYKNLFILISILKKFVPEVRIVSNGTLLNKYIVQELLNCGLDVFGFSIDAGDNETLKRIRGITLEKLLDKISLFNDFKEKIEIRIASTICEDNAVSSAEIPRILGINNLNRIIRRIKYSYALGDIESLGLKKMSLSTYKKFKMNAINNSKKYNIEVIIPSFKEAHKKILNNGICLFPFTGYVGINADMEIIPCCTWTRRGVKKIGTSFRKAWNSQEMKSTRRQLLNKKYYPDCIEYCNVLKK